MITLAEQICVWCSSVAFQTAWFFQGQWNGLDQTWQNLELHPKQKNTLVKMQLQSACSTVVGSKSCEEKKN